MERKQRRRKKTKKKREEEGIDFKRNVEAFKDRNYGNLEPTQGNFEDERLVPKRFDLFRIGIQSTRRDIVIFLCVALNQGYDLLPTRGDLEC